MNRVIVTEESSKDTQNCWQQHQQKQSTCITCISWLAAEADADGDCMLDGAYARDCCVYTILACGWPPCIIWTSALSTSISDVVIVGVKQCKVNVKWTNIETSWMMSTIEDVICFEPAIVRHDLRRSSKHRRKYVLIFPGNVLYNDRRCEWHNSDAT